jgi:hypothetical protein
MVFRDVMPCNYLRGVEVWYLTAQCHFPEDKFTAVRTCLVQEALFATLYITVFANVISYVAAVISKHHGQYDKGI